MFEFSDLGFVISDPENVCIENVFKDYYLQPYRVFLLILDNVVDVGTLPNTVFHSWYKGTTRTQIKN